MICVCGVSLLLKYKTFQDRNHSSIMSDIITLSHSEVLLSNEKAIASGYKQTARVTFIFLNDDTETWPSTLPSLLRGFNPQHQLDLHCVSSPPLASNAKI